MQEQVTLPYGTALDGESTRASNRRFTSYERSQKTGLDYAVNRHYDPQQGRFTQVDPLGMRAASLANPQSLNLYAYCGNDPINQTDAAGLFWGKLFRAIGKLFSAVWKVLAWAAAIFLTFVAIVVPELAPGTWILAAMMWAYVLGGDRTRQYLSLSGSIVGILGNKPSLIIENFGLGRDGDERRSWAELLASLTPYLSHLGTISTFLAQKKPIRTIKDFKKEFYEKYGKDVNRCIKEVFAKDYIDKFGRKRLESAANSPILNVSKSGKYLEKLTGHSGTMAAPEPRVGVNGTIYIDRVAWKNPAVSFETISHAYAHELGNVLSYKISLDFNTYGDPRGIGASFSDIDTGAKFEKCIFGNVDF